ncbi:hypothetical protein C1752_03196 [Acaryochloris thomasi RCC1774]|uniref:Uncharacterized protein n=1 Tax=Acaryochloris thomasi RCC1774 TaxID=1764569 RepID=A0A2W1JH32_9CYAN|nr:hypothetical protein [Acaryochloris thomasi]PZD72869.1 hypothetical protein C1752_03196 [Acaryochloris thomasi RCC1774]
MGQLERLVLIAEDELTQYSTDARKRQKLRQKIGISVQTAERTKVKEDLIAEMPNNFFGKLIEEQRQAVALPFWGIAGLGLLFGISFRQPLDFMGPAICVPIAFNLQKWGWRLQAKRLVIQAIEEIEAEADKPAQDKS